MRRSEAARVIAAGAGVDSACEGWKSLDHDIRRHLAPELWYFWRWTGAHLLRRARETIRRYRSSVAQLVEECVRLRVENETLKRNAVEAKRVRQQYDKLRAEYRSLTIELTQQRLRGGDSNGE